MSSSRSSKIGVFSPKPSRVFFGFDHAHLTNVNAKCRVYSTRIAAEAQHGLIAQVLKDIIFSTRPQTGSLSESASARIDNVVEAVMTS